MIASKGKLECLLSPRVLWAEQLSKATLFPLSRCSEEDANEHILILQNHQILSKKPNRMSSSPANLFSDGEGLYCYKSSNQRGHNKKDAVFFFRNNRHFLIILMNIIIYFLIIPEAAKSKIETLAGFSSGKALFCLADSHCLTVSLHGLSSVCAPRGR